MIKPLSCVERLDRGFFLSEKEFGQFVPSFVKRRRAACIWMRRRKAAVPEMLWLLPENFFA